jgi:hypothetical protein
MRHAGEEADDRLVGPEGKVGCAFVKLVGPHAEEHHVAALDHRRVALGALDIRVTRGERPRGFL